MAVVAATAERCQTCRPGTSQVALAVEPAGGRLTDTQGTGQMAEPETAEGRLACRPGVDQVAVVVETAKWCQRVRHGTCQVALVGASPRVLRLAAGALVALVGARPQALTRADQAADLPASR